MLNPPIPATFHGAPVRVYGTTPDGRVLIAHDDGKTETTIWESLRVEPVVPGTILTFAGAAQPPPEPWGEWVKFIDQMWGATWIRRRCFGMEKQYVRHERDGWIWRWGALRDGDGFASMDDARTACEAYTARVEGAPAPMPADDAVGEE